MREEHRMGVFENRVLRNTDWVCLKTGAEEYRLGVFENRVLRRIHWVCLRTGC
jgi:hypothetical protein